MKPDFISLQPVRESEGESTWEMCAPADAQAWRAMLICGNDGRAWTYKRKADAQAAIRDFHAGRIQPLKLSGLAQLSPRTIYLP